MPSSSSKSQCSSVFQGHFKASECLRGGAQSYCTYSSRCAVTYTAYNITVTHRSLGLIVDLPIPGGASPQRLVGAVRGMLDFLYLAQYPIHSTETLDLLDTALQRFHENKSIFVQLGVRNAEWKIPKLHWLGHYRDAIRRLGTADNFNTEYTERLHIDLAKDAYAATNGKDVYSQMTLWLERKEKIERHSRFVNWRLHGRPHLASLNPLSPCQMQPIRMTKWPSAQVDIEDLEEQYGATDFKQALREYIVKFQEPGLTRQQISQRIVEMPMLPIVQVPVYHKARFWDSVCTSMHQRTRYKTHPILLTIRIF